MKLISTKNNNISASLEEAIFQGLPPDNGLYLPDSFTQIDPKDIIKAKPKTFPELADYILRHFLKDDLDKSTIHTLCNAAFDFPVPLVPLDEEKKVQILELWHGPTLAFKDFGARFMAQIMSFYLRKKDKKINILVATSGDTGSAIANGFLDLKNIKVTILFPKGKVSEIQQKQLTTNGKNIDALEIDGTFDDCQKLVKTAFLDTQLNNAVNLSSANSINIARLIPQSLYYWWAWYQLQLKSDNPIVFCTPSGNFGNLCGGIIAHKMGMPVQQFIAATNSNDVVPQYFSTGEYRPRPSISSLSNAMDVGAPSNFPRMQSLYGNNFEQLKKYVTSLKTSEEETKKTINHIFKSFNYKMCPHTAVGYHALSLQPYFHEKNITKVLLSTAHPSKFLSIINNITKENLTVPDRLASVFDKKENYFSLSNRYDDFKSYILESS